MGLKSWVATKIGLFASKIHLRFNGNVPEGDRTTLRDWGVGSGDTLTIQVPAPLPDHVQLKLGFQFAEWANSKLKGQDTMIFFVNPSTESFCDFKGKVASRLDYMDWNVLKFTRDGVEIIGVWGTLRKWRCGEREGTTLASIGVLSGDCELQCHKHMQR